MSAKKRSAGRRSVAERARWSDRCIRCRWLFTIGVFLEHPGGPAWAHQTNNAAGTLARSCGVGVSQSRRKVLRCRRHCAGEALRPYRFPFGRATPLQLLRALVRLRWARSCALKNMQRAAPLYYFLDRSFGSILPTASHTVGTRFLPRAFSLLLLLTPVAQ